MDIELFFIGIFQQCSGPISVAAISLSLSLNTLDKTLYEMALIIGSPS